MNDSRFPWLILIPMRQGITEVHQLQPGDQQLLIAESSLVSALLMDFFAPHKINIGALGNLVPQLHWHLVARSRNDPCWPGPVWGCGQALPYAEQEGLTLIREISGQLP
jgi:diadenosine tetraphosphate (Ap4A) HIT family hydrolase